MMCIIMYYIWDANHIMPHFCSSKQILSHKIRNKSSASIITARLNVFTEMEKHFGVPIKTNIVYLVVTNLLTDWAWSQWWLQTAVFGGNETKISTLLSGGRMKYSKKSLQERELVYFLNKFLMLEIATPELKIFVCKVFWAWVEKVCWGNQTWNLLALSSCVILKILRLTLCQLMPLFAPQQLCVFEIFGQSQNSSSVCADWKRQDKIKDSEINFCSQNLGSYNSLSAF